MKDQLTPRGRGVDILLQALEPDASSQQVTHRVNQVRQRATQAVEFPDHERVTGPTLLERLGQAGPLRLGSTGDIGKKAFTTDGLQCIFLEVKVLVVR